MKVYVAEEGVYHERAIVGVYATLEAAMAANPVPTGSRVRKERDGDWQQDGSDGYWSNGLDFSEAVTIFEFEVEGPDLPSDNAVESPVGSVQDPPTENQR